METNLPKLPYVYDALEPYIDEETMHIHHDKHHQAYFDKFLAAIANHQELKNKDVKEILANLDQVPKEIRQAVINHGGGYYHHSFFWSILKKDIPFQGEIAQAIEKRWGSLEEFKEEFSKAALTVFGSGWAWLVLNKDKLEIVQTKNQDSPLSEGKVPLLSLDVWEHSYYLKYQNKRAEYIQAFWNVVNWEQVDKYYIKETS
ncbi:MAG: superoxide dismutase [Candidatus Woesearchaeota archaeon]